jgi:hypothetical protein
VKGLAIGLTLALITAGSATAAFVVTSKNIKNGTIQLVDISPRAKKALRGQRGLRGPQGRQGIQAVTEIRSLQIIIPPGQSGSAEATCPAGQLPISGGFIGVQWATVIGSAANSSTRAWVVAAFNTSSTTTAPLTAVAYCSPRVTISQS